MEESEKNVTQIYKHPNPEARIEEAQKLIQNMSQKQFQISRKIEERMFDRCRYHSLSGLMERSVENCRERENLNRLQVILDKLCCSNNAYQRKAPLKKDLDLLQQALDKMYSEKFAYRGRAPNSCSLVEELDNNFQKSHLQMLHGRNTLAEEKKLLKKINASQKRAIGSCFSLNELDEAISWFHYTKRWGLWSFKQNADKEQIERETKQLVCAREIAIANAAAKGKLWNSFGSKQDIRDQIKVMETKFDRTRKQVLSLRVMETKLESIEKDIKSLQKQLIDTNIRKGEAHKCILQLRKQQNEESLI